MGDFWGVGSESCGLKRDADRWLCLGIEYMMQPDSEPGYEPALGKITLGGTQRMREVLSCRTRAMS